MTSEIESTFLITHADADSAVLTDVYSEQVHTLVDNPGLTEGDVVVGTLAPDPPLELTWRLIDTDDRWSITIERSDEPPTAHARELAADQPVGAITRNERAGTGEIHVLTVEPENTEQAVTDVADDEATLSRGARLGVERVELRWGGDTGVVTIRYLP